MKYFIIPIALIFTALIMSTDSNAQPAKAKARINHMALSVTDLKVSAPFYDDVIGLDTIPEPFHDGLHTWFSIGDKAHLHLIQGRKPNDPVPTKNTHLCFSSGDLDALISTLKKHNISFEDWAGTKGKVNIRVDGIRQIWFQDPDGYWIEANDDF
ncbi:hypothetical protein HY58_09690 [Flavihumibacter sp. ZG627]|nr:hypothetical protein HY58_09690 [Flavihumibacter sp. ZG627]